MRMKDDDGGLTFRFRTYEEFIKNGARQRDCEQEDEHLPENLHESCMELPSRKETETVGEDELGQIQLPEKIKEQERWNFEEFGFVSSQEFSDSESESVTSSQNFSQLIDSNSEAVLSDIEITGLSENCSLGEEEDETERVLKEESDQWSRMEMLWEQQDLIEQLKMEVRKVKTSYLPTILEEDSEFPKIPDDVKPWKIEESSPYDSPITELHSFYRDYRARMRKLDILNYQKTYAIRFLQLKDPLNFIPDCKTKTSSSISFIRLFPRRKIKEDSNMKFMKEIHADLEQIYVSQMCLAWEILHFQYEKALKLSESDRSIRFNRAAGEFQQFQVLIERFVEDEPFHGHRVLNYVKNRSASSIFLQVPAIRADRLRTEIGSISSENAITSDVLVECLRESIRIFWKFLQEDKDANLCGITEAELEDQDDASILMELRSDLEQKEKKTKELLRNRHCVLKKFQKREEDDDCNPIQYFFSQVDMRVVRRVLNMRKITKNQLIWSRRKLSNISFVAGKINVEPSFLPFPC